MRSRCLPWSPRRCRRDGRRRGKRRFTVRRLIARRGNNGPTRFGAVLPARRACQHANRKGPASTKGRKVATRVGRLQQRRFLGHVSTAAWLGVFRRECWWMRVTRVRGAAAAARLPALALCLVRGGPRIVFRPPKASRRRTRRFWLDGVVSTTRGASRTCERTRRLPYCRRSRPRTWRAPRESGRPGGL